MPQKGIELPVNSVIIIALAIFVLLMLAAFFGKSGGEIDKTQINTAFNQGCSQLSTSYNCDYTRINEVKTNLVINGQAKTLLQVCQMSFNDLKMSAFKCRKACQVCPNRVYDGSPCEDGTDCNTPLTSDWECKSCNDILEDTCKDDRKSSENTGNNPTGQTNGRLLTDEEKKACLKLHTNGREDCNGDTSKYCILLPASPVNGPK